MAGFVQCCAAAVVRPGWVLGQAGAADKDTWLVESVASRVSDRYMEITVSHPSARKLHVQTVPQDEVLFRYVDGVH